jgi:Ca2+-transporting ATPase
MNLIKHAHSLPILTIVEQSQSNLKEGLDDSDVQTRLAQFGYNVLETQKRRSLIRIFLAQFISPLVWVLGVAAGLAFLFQEWLEGGLLW